MGSKSLTIENETGKSFALRYRAKLDTVSDCRREVARIYREARSGIIDSAECSRLAFVLKTLSGMIESGDLERRLEILEHTHENVS